MGKIPSSIFLQILWIIRNYEKKLADQRNLPFQWVSCMDKRKSRELDFFRCNLF